MPGPRVFILLQEDDLFCRVRSAFESMGLTCPNRPWSNPRHARSYLRDTSMFAGRHVEPIPAAIILDLEYPQQESFLFLQWLRFHPRFRPLCIIGTGARDFTFTVHMALDAGMDAYYNVPDELDQLAGWFKDQPEHPRVTSLPG